MLGALFALPQSIFNYSTVEVGRVGYNVIIKTSPIDDAYVLAM